MLTGGYKTRVSVVQDSSQTGKKLEEGRIREVELDHVGLVMLSQGKPKEWN